MSNREINMNDKHRMPMTWKERIFFLPDALRTWWVVRKL